MLKRFQPLAYRHEHGGQHLFFYYRPEHQR